MSLGAFNGNSFSSTKQIAARFNQQFNTSKLGIHTSSREISNKGDKEEILGDGTDIHHGSSEESNQELSNKLSIFHLRHLGPRDIEYIAALFNLSVTTCQIPAIWKSSLIISIPKPGKDTSVGTSYRPISLLCESTGVSDSAHYQQISPTCSRPTRFKTRSSSTSALLQMTTYIAMGFNQRKPPDRTICVAVDLSAAFDTMCHNNLLSKINRSQLPRTQRDICHVI